MKSSWKVLFLILAAATATGAFAAVFACGDDDDDDEDPDEVDDDDDAGEEDDDTAADDDAADDDATDDDDTAGDDDDDSGTPDCTVEEMCTHVITDCLYEYDMQTCQDSFLEGCDDPVGYQACSCDCMDDYPGVDETSCGNFWECAFTACWVAYCPESPEK